MVCIPGTQFRGAHTALLALILWAYLMISSEEILPGGNEKINKRDRISFFPSFFFTTAVFNFTKLYLIYLMHKVSEKQLFAFQVLRPIHTAETIPTKNDCPVYTAPTIAMRNN